MEWKGETSCECARRLNQACVPAKAGGKWFPSTIDSVRHHAVIADIADRPDVIVCDAEFKAAILFVQGIKAVAAIAA